MLVSAYIDFLRRDTPEFPQLKGAAIKAYVAAIAATCAEFAVPGTFNPGHSDAVEAKVRLRTAALYGVCALAPTPPLCCCR